MNKIFTFWEPKDKIPFYLKLCIETWKRNLPDFEIVVLDYSNIFNYIDKNTFNKILYNKKYFSLPQVADCFRIALLYKYGGIWLDLDTIVTNDLKYLKKEKEKTELLTINYHNALLWGDKNSKILKEWLDNIKEKLDNFHNIKRINFLIKYYRIINNKKKKNILKRFKRIHYTQPCLFGANIMKKVFLNKIEKEVLMIDKNKLGFPEFNYILEESNNINKYLKFYFFENNNINIQEVINNNEIICLHNSWTPKEYKNNIKTFKDMKKDNSIISKLLLRTINIL